MTESDRITSLEARLAAAEARIAELERHAQRYRPVAPVWPVPYTYPIQPWPPIVTCGDSQ